MSVHAYNFKWFTWFLQISVHQKINFVTAKAHDGLLSRITLEAIHLTDLILLAENTEVETDYRWTIGNRLYVDYSKHCRNRL